MASETEFNRTFLSYPVCQLIYNEDERYQNTSQFPNGPPGRQARVDSDPVYKYHVNSCPRYPQRAPGRPIDPTFNALLARDAGMFEPLVIIPKRSQDFKKSAEPWELTNSILCGASGRFIPIVNKSMEVTGHYQGRYGSAGIIHPKGIKFATFSEYIEHDVDVLFITAAQKMPDGWESFYDSHRWQGGIDVYVLPNGKIVDGFGYAFTEINGAALPTWSPLDFLTPGTRVGAKAVRWLTNRLSLIGKGGWMALRNPTKELAQLALSRWVGKTLPGVAVSSTAALPVATQGRRILILGDDMAVISASIKTIPSQSGLYDVVIHADKKSFYILQNSQWIPVSTKDVANVIRPNLGPGEKVRLIACESGCLPGGPAQMLSNELSRSVWAPTETVFAGQGAPIVKNGKVVDLDKTKSIVPVKNGKFYEFAPQGGAPNFSSSGRTTNANVIKHSNTPVKK